MNINTQCSQCNNKDFCKHFEYIKQNHNLTITISDCKFFNSGSNVSSTVTIESPVKEKEIKETVIPSMAERIYPNLNSNDNVALLNKMSDNIASMKVEAVEISKVKCERCLKEVLSTDIDNCNTCHRAICYNCSVATVDKDTGGVVTTCEGCWSGAPDPDPNENAPVKISYGETKTEWDLMDFSQREVDTKKEVEEDVKPETKHRNPNKKSKDK